MSSSAKFKLEVKATESSVANFSSGTKDTNIILIPDYYSNIHYAVIGTKPAEPSQVYISVGSNGYDTTVATFSESNINFHKDTIVRGNLVIDGFLTALELDVVLSQKEIFEGTNHSHNGFIDAGSNVLSFKYAELTDTSITYTSNTITQKIQSSFSNLYIAGKNVLQGNSDFLEGFSSQDDPYTVDKFHERLASKTADDIVNGTTNRYINNDKYNNNLVVKGDFTADNITTKTIYAEDEVSAGTLYGDGSYLTNIIAGDGTINSITEGCNLFYKPEYVGEIAAASNIHASNYVAALYNAELQTAILAKFEETSNFATGTSNMLADTLCTEMTNISNYVASDFTGIEQLILNDYNYIDANILDSSNYMQNFNAVYLQTDALSNLLIETIVPAIADASNYIQQTSNTLYTNLSITDTNVLVDLQTQLDAIIQLQAEKWANISNMILGEVGYSNLFATSMKTEYGIHLDSYIVSSSNQAAVETDMQTSNTILHIDDIKANSIDTKTEYYFQHMADIATILTDTYTLIDSNSQASSNAVDVVCQNILNYLNDVIQGHILHLNDTCNLFHYTSNVTQTAIKDILKNTLDYERNSSNELMYTLDANIARLLGNASFVLNKTNADISGKLSSLDTDKIPEGTSNIYYTEAEFDRLFAKLTFDNFQQGANNKFIVNNVYNGNLRVLGTIFASNMVIDGELSTILTNVYQSGAARISSSNETPLSIAQYDNSAYIFGLSNTVNNPIFTVDNSGSIAINRTSASQDVDVSGILKAPMLKGLASTITDVNLDSKGTDFLAEGVNLYFNSSRVSYLIDTSNLDISNYVIGTSNNLLEGFSIIRSQSNYIDQQSNIVYAYSSNININTFNYLNLIVANVSNIVGISSNNHSNYVLRTSNALIAYTSNSLVNISNYVITTSNVLLGQLKFNEYIQSNYLTIVNSAISFAKAESDGSNYVLRSSNMLSAYMDNAKFEFHQSNYAVRSCNMLFNSIRSSNFHMSNYLIITSNNVMRSISTSNLNISNYIWRTSNELMTYVLNNIGGVSATTNSYTITDVFTSDKIMHFNFNNLKIINNADDPNFQLLNRTTITPVYPNISALTSVNNFFTQYETTNRYALASSNNIYVFNNDDTDAKTLLNMMNTSGFVMHFVFRAQFVQNTPIYFIGNNVRSFVNIKLWYGNLQMMLGTGTDAITLVCLTPIVPFTWYIVDIVGAITGGNISFKVWLNSIQQNIIVRRNTSVSSVGLLQTSVYNNILNYDGVNPIISPSIVPTTISGNDMYLAFRNDANTTDVTYTVTFTKDTYCDVLLVGGGGGGGYRGGGGGGGGDVVMRTNQLFTTGTYTVVVGKGGTGGIANTATVANNGSTSSITKSNFIGLYAAGGGRGTSYVTYSTYSPNAPTAGSVSDGNFSSGGGGGADNYNVNSFGSGNGVSGNGGTSISYGSCGGGGGATGNGGNATSTNAGNGGTGQSSTITGTTEWYGGGGGGGGETTTNSGYGIHGGGNGAHYDNSQQNTKNGMLNTGGGGGGSGTSAFNIGTGGNGGSGIVILRSTNFFTPPIGMLLGCSNLIDTYEENFAYTQGATYTNTYYSSNPWTMTAPAPILRSVASDYWSFSNLIFSSYYASNFDYQYSLGISSANVVNNAFFDNADARLTIGDRVLTKLNYVFTEVETNVRLRTGYYFFMLDLQNEITADLLLGEQSDTKIDDYFNVANYYNYNNNVLTTTPSASITHANNRVLANPLYIPEGYYRFYLRMFRTIANRNNRYFISQYYYTNTWSGTSYSFNNSNVVSYIPYSSLSSPYQSGRTNFNDLFVVNNNVTGATSNLYVYRYFDNKSYSCGDNYYGQLGINSITQSTILVPVRDTIGNAGTTIKNISQIAAGYDYAMFLEKDTGKVYACGDNTAGQLGIGSTTQSSILVPVRDTTGNAGTAITNISQVAAGGYSSLFLEKNTGKVYACGTNSTGQLGIPSVSESTILVPVRDTEGTNPITNISQVAAGWTHSLFLEKDTGKVYACGDNGFGQLGINSTNNSFKLVPVRDTTGNAGTAITNISQVAAGQYYSLFLEKGTGKVYSCGANSYGQLGINAAGGQSTILVPVRDTTGNAGTTITNISQVVTKINFSLFLEKDTGKVYACGANNGAFGDNSTQSSSILIPVRDTTGNAGTTITNISQVSVGRYHSLFLEKGTGKVYSSGLNYQGPLGIGSTTHSTILVPVRDTTGNAGTAITNISQIAAGENQSYFLLDLSLLAYVSNYNYSISHSNVITPNTFFAANRLSSSNLLNIQDFKILNNPTLMASDFAINNILYNGKDSSNLVSLNKIRFNKWRETDDYASLTNKYVYYTEGNVGIGPYNNAPTASLDINTYPLTTFDTSTIYSMKTNRPVWTNLGLITSSDERIKKNIQDIDDNVALNQILKVEPKSYNYIDRNNTSSNIYGFIAQQIREVIPQAISLHTEAVPNIYSIATLQSNIITVNLPSLSSAKQVLLIDVLGNRYVENISQLLQPSQHSQTSIEIENKHKIPDGPIFVYGTIVNDFHALDKSYIYTLNVCALQDVYKNYANLKDQLSTYMQSYSNITQQPLTEYDNTSLVANQNELKNQIDLLKYANDTLMQNITIIKQLQTSNYAEMEQLKAENDLLTAANSEITREHENLIKQISEQSQEIFTIKSILQLNNVV